MWRLERELLVLLYQRYGCSFVIIISLEKSLEAGNHSMIVSSGSSSLRYPFWCLVHQLAERCLGMASEIWRDIVKRTALQEV